MRNSQPNSGWGILHPSEHRRLRDFPRLPHGSHPAQQVTGPWHGQETDLWFSDSSRSGAQAGTWARQSRRSKSFCSRRPLTLQQEHYLMIKARGRKPGGGMELGWFTAHRVDWVFEDVVMTLWAHRAAVWWGPVLFILSLTVLRKCSLGFG